MLQRVPALSYVATFSSFGDLRSIGVVAIDLLARHAYSDLVDRHLSCHTPHAAPPTRLTKVSPRLGGASRSGAEAVVGSTYGANGKYAFRLLSGQITCNKATFGDPIFGVVKGCHMLPPHRQFVAAEGQSFANNNPTPIALMVGSPPRRRREPAYCLQGWLFAPTQDSSPWLTAAGRRRWTCGESAREP